MNEIAELYSDYLIASFGMTTATGLSELLDGEISHDKITRFLAGQKRTNQDLWRVEEYHKSLKQNVSLAKSLTHTETTQTNHFFAALCGYIKLERLKIKTKLNHFALKQKLYLKVLMSAF